MSDAGNQRISLAALAQPEATTGAEAMPAALVFYHDSPSAVKPLREAQGQILDRWSSANPGATGFVHLGYREYYATTAT